VSIFVNKQTKLLVQGITGKEGQFHARACIEYGTQVVAGVTPGKGGQKMDDVPVFNTVSRCRQDCRRQRQHDFRAPALCRRRHHGSRRRRGSPDRLHHRGHSGDGHDAGEELSQGQTGASHRAQLPRYHHARRVQDRHHAGVIHQPGKIGVGLPLRHPDLRGRSRPDRTGLGQTTCIGIGGDPVNGTNFIDCLEAFQADDATEGIVMIGEIGGDAEEKAAEYIKANVTKPVVGFIAGLTAPPGRRMGHAGAIISGSSGTGQSKVAAMKANGINVCENLAYLAMCAPKPLTARGA
jgi:succinyl-CoA synthetase alpha subunit